ncbi:MAG: SprT-like domain-containing protein [Acidobacteriota bacterium]
MIEYEQLHLYSPVTSDDILESVFDQALRALVKKEPRPKVEARFYPYAGLSSTIRLRQGRVLARVSDILVGSPREVLFALASILVAKLYRLKASKVHEHVYRAHTLHPPILDASQAARRRRGYKITTSSCGKVYDLAELFTQLNARYFDGKLELPMLSWSQRQTRRVLGHHDHVHRTIIISSTLDDAAIPRFVVEYVLYHEMLHVKHPARMISGRTIYHGPWFRDDERLFERFEEALKWLEKIAAPARRKNRRHRRRPCN